MRGWAKNAGCPLILLWSLLSSLCVFCPDMRASRTSAHDCCKHSRPHSQKPCPGHETAFESQGKVELPGLGGAIHLAIQTTAPAPVAPAVIPASAPFTPALRHPPPERFLLNSVLLI
jgi:hypothetical protein